MRDTAVDENLRQQAREWAERTAIESRLPPKIQDTAILRRVLRLTGFLDQESPNLADRV